MHSTYPHGDAIILPQLLTLMAVFSSLMAFPVLNWDGNYSFMCVQPESNGETGSGVCFPLALNSQTFWQNDSAEGWAGAVQAGALFGIFAVSSGFFALSLLFTAICFRLKPRRILSVLILQAVAAFFSIFTLVAGAADACEYAGISDCSKSKSRMATGASFMLFAFFIYIAAGAVTALFFLEVRKEHTPLPNKQETQPLTHKPTMPHEMAAAPQAAASAQGVTESRTVNPDGTVRMEREYVDEEGQLVKEITIEEPEGMSPQQVEKGDDF